MTAVLGKTVVALDKTVVALDKLAKVEGLLEILAPA
jgi:hypothetical protein